MTVEERLAALLDERDARIEELERLQAGPDPVKTVDEFLDAILKRPGMYGALDPHSLEILVLTHLRLRSVWVESLDSSCLPWHTVYGRWIMEYFGDKTPKSATAASRLEEKFGWEPGVHPYSDERKDDWAEIVSFYEELVRREREAAAAYAAKKNADGEESH